MQIYTSVQNEIQNGNIKKNNIGKKKIEKTLASWKKKKMTEKWGKTLFRYLRKEEINKERRNVKEAKRTVSNINWSKNRVSNI